MVDLYGANVKVNIPGMDRHGSSGKLIRDINDAYIIIASQPTPPNVPRLRDKGLLTAS